MVGVSRMYADRQTCQPGGAYLASEHICLHIRRRAFVVVVQASLADPDHLGMARCKVCNVLLMRQNFFRCLVRVDADRAPEVVSFRGNGDLFAGAGQTGADRYHLTYTGLRRSHPHGNALLGGKIVQVTV